MAIKSALLKLKNTYMDCDEISNKELLGFAGGIFGNAMGQDSTNTFSDKFDRDFRGISNNLMMIKGNVTTILSFFIPPMAGTLYDLPTRPGKKSNIHKALMSAPIPFAISSMLLYVIPTGSVMFNFVWSLFFNILFAIVDAFYDIALNALSLKMVSCPSDRKKFFTFETIASVLGSMAPGSVIPIFVGMVDGFNAQKNMYFFISLGFCILGVISMYLPYFTIKDRCAVAQAEYEEKKRQQNTEKVKWDKNAIRAILRNRPFMVVQVSSICETVRQITYSILPYLYEDSLGDFKVKAIGDAISGSLSYVGLLAVPFVGKKFSAKTMLVGGYLYSSLWYGIMSLFNIGFKLERVRKLKYLVALLIGLSGIPNAMQGASKKILVADSTDYMEWYSEKNYGAPIRSDGLLSATQNIVSKINGLIKTNLYNGIFNLIGYKNKDLNTDVKAVQSDSTLHGIYAVASLCGLIGNVLPAICYMFDNYSGARKEKIYAELCEMRARREELLKEIEE